MINIMNSLFYYDSINNFIQYLTTNSKHSTCSTAWNNLSIACSDCSICSNNSSALNVFLNSRINIIIITFTYQHQAIGIVVTSLGGNIVPHVNAIVLYIIHQQITITMTIILIQFCTFLNLHLVLFR